MTIVPLDHHWDSYKKKIWSLKLEFPQCVRFVKTASLTSIKLSTLMDTFIPLHCGKIDPALAFIRTAGALYSSHKGYPPHSTPLHPYTPSNFLLKLASASVKHFQLYVQFVNSVNSISSVYSLYRGATSISDGILSCPGQLNRWPCQSLTHSLTQ